MQPRLGSDRRRRQRRAPGLAALLIGLLAGCGDPPAPPAATDWRFEDVSAQAGIAFTHVHGGSGRRYLVETMGSGGGFLDADGDGWMDILLLQGQPLPGHAREGESLGSRLFRNRGDGRFEDVSAGAGLDDIGYAQGACFGDIDNDGRIDIHVAVFGPDRLLRNLGGGRFEDVTTTSGIDNPAWASACAFADIDRDGWLDLYVVNYLDAGIERHVRCGPAQESQYCHPDVHAGVPDRLYRNLGNGRFEEISARAGIRIEDPAEAKGLGVAFADLDGDGWQDIYVANDSTRNFLFMNRGDGRFEEVGVLHGAAYNEHGRTEAGMGIAAADVDGDGATDLFVTHLDFETNTLYRNLGNGMFEDYTVASGLGGPSVTRVGFGTVAFDAELDGDSDLFVANGHVLDNIAALNPSLSHAQPDQLFLNDGSGRFVEAFGGAGGVLFGAAEVSRAAAAGDIDNDGRVELLVTANNGPARLWRNRTPTANRWIGLHLRSRHGGRDAIGARVRLLAGGRWRSAEVRAGSSYQAQEDPRLVFGLGALERIERIEIRWPEGEAQVLVDPGLALDAYHAIRQPPAVDPAP